MKSPTSNPSTPSTRPDGENKTEIPRDLASLSEKTDKAEHVEDDNDADSIADEAVGNDHMETRYFRHWRLIGSMLAMVFSYAVGFWAYIMPSFALTVINADLGPSVDIIWVVLALTVCQTVSFTIVGRMSDLFGRRHYQLAFGAIAFIGYIVASRAKTVNTLIGANVLIGFGSATQVHCAAIGGELLPNKHRYMYQSVVSCLFVPISAIAPGIALALCTTAQTWRSIYYLLGGLTAVAFALFAVCYNPPSFEQLHTRHTKRQFIETLDYVGLFLFIGGIVPFILGLSWGGQRYPWKSGKVIGTIVGGFCGLVLFVLWERFANLKIPLLPLRLFANRNFVCLVICSSLGSMVFYALSILYPEQLEIVFGKNTTQMGWYACTLTAGVLAGEAIAGVTVRVIRHIKYQLIVSCIIFTVFVGANAAAKITLPMAAAFSFLSTLGIGYMEIITITGAPLMSDPKDFGIAIGAIFSIRVCFSTISDAIYVSILNNKVASNLVKYVIPAAIKAGLSESSAVQLLEAIATSNTPAIAKIPGITTAAIEAATVATHTAYFKAFQIVYYVSIPFGSCAIIAAILANGAQLEAKLTGDVARKLQGIDPLQQVHVETLNA